MSDFHVRKAPLTTDEQNSIALAEDNAMRSLRQRAGRWLRDDTFRPFSGFKELNTARCIADCKEYARAIFQKSVETLERRR